MLGNAARECFNYKFFACFACAIFVCAKICASCARAVREGVGGRGKVMGLGTELEKEAGDSRSSLRTACMRL